MTIRTIGYTVLTVAILAVSGCNGTGSITTPWGSIGVNGAVQNAFTTTDSSTQVQSVVGKDAVAYRASSDDANTDNWLIDYYSPSTKKSYRCTERSKTVISVVEITDTTLIYQPSYDIDRSQVKVDVSVAQQAAATAASSAATPAPTATPTAAATASPDTSASATPSPAPTATPTAAPTPSAAPSVTPTSFNKTKLISATECKAQTGKDAGGPVYVVTNTTVNVTVYVSAKDGSVITKTSSSTSTSTSVSVGGGNTSVSTGTNVGTNVNVGGTTVGTSTGTNTTVGTGTTGTTGTGTGTTTGSTSGTSTGTTSTTM